MRVVAGSARGRRLVAPRGPAVRPTSDRVREATFNALTSLGAVEGAVVLDAFAGTGALGIEALSRGASSATFVDSSRHAVAAIADNLRITGLSDRADVICRDVLEYLVEPSRFDLALLDPPYEFDGWADVLELVDSAVVVVESDRHVTTGERWRVVREKRYAGTVVAIAVRSSDME
ncbi:MAG: 16S rRNA (guanine(966)-N(2))-methyltransferase RsmD [Actinobacteria bacterium]|nr:MAG: 16S rRNA (guanine(966)-N(2))-methyltransferase RsmD [Actinomycetota bacterium]RIK08440.1 MAG: 16S rRNA (guanine(966)-N(2))-methyltransferase RsmD [Acidobacteriota bacterium]